MALMVRRLCAGVISARYRFMSVCFSTVQVIPGKTRGYESDSSSLQTLVSHHLIDPEITPSTRHCQY
jgi:hypothetical protein